MQELQRRRMQQRQRRYSKKNPEGLLSQTLMLLKRCKLRTSVIAERADVPYQWLAKFRGFYIDNPGVLMLQRLHDFLAVHVPEAEAQRAAEEAAKDARRAASTEQFSSSNASESNPQRESAAA